MKMPFKRNLLENITIIANSGTIFCILLHYLTDISLLAGKWFLLYILIVFIFSVFFSFRVIQWLLHLNKPICYDLDAIVAKYPYLARLRGFLPELPKPAKVEWKEYDTNELSVISTVLERKLVSSWYVPYISQEIGFPFACKQMLDQMIGRAFQICSNIETKDVFVDTSTVLISHLKEYEKAVKRHEKSPSSSIESLYKKSHSISDPDKNYSSVDHCTNILRLMIKELLPWELRDTPHSELLVRILSKKLDSFINSTLADPSWLNDRLMTYLTGEEYIELKQEEPKEPTKTEEVIKKDEKEKESLEAKREIEEQKIEEVMKEECQGTTESVAEVHPAREMKDVKSSPVLRQKRGRQGRSEVKIYDRIIEGSTKTWETDMDLQCISLGQDLLASLDGEITLSRLWGQEDHDHSPDAGGKSPHQHAAVLEELPEPESYSSLRHSPKPLPLTAPGSKPPTDKGAQILTAGGPQHLTSGGAQHLGGAPTVPAEALLALQASVSHAKHKIGDLQVNDIDVAGASDEAAGMMEGLLDFGIAGLKKGLRFTGLSDDSQEKSPSHVKERADKSPPLEWSKPHLSDLLLKGEENGNGIPHLVKQQRVTSQDSMASQARAIPTPAPPAPPCESPEPQYEEAADLSTSIAKLRRLLRQRAEAAPNNRGGEVWWEGAEETRGRTTHHQSTRPVDAATLADEYDMSLDRSSPNQGSNNMQRLDKLFHRTVTGVFNSIKTAVGADEAAPPHAQQWAYVHTSNELSVCVVAARLAWARRGRGVEAALDSLTLHAEPPAPPPPEDLDEWLSVQGRAWSAASGLSMALHSHVAHRLATLLLADSCECIFACWLQSLAAWLRAQLFLTFSRMEEGAPVHTDTKRPLDVDHTARVILEKLPELSVVFGEDTVSRSVRRAVRSASHGAVNRDVVHRVLDLWALHFKQAAGVRNPSFDAN